MRRRRLNWVSLGSRSRKLIAHTHRARLPIVHMRLARRTGQSEEMVDPSHRKMCMSKQHAAPPSSIKNALRLATISSGCNEIKKSWWPVACIRDAARSMSGVNGLIIPTIYDLGELIGKVLDCCHDDMLSKSDFVRLELSMPSLTWIRGVPAASVGLWLFPRTSKIRFSIAYVGSFLV